MQLSRSLTSIVARRPLVCTAVVVVALKLGFLALDDTPLYFIGDSATYIGAALNDYVPSDRSYVYPLVIRALAVWPHSLFALVLAQVLASAATAWLLALFLVRYLLVRPIVAMAAALALSLAPSQILHERMVLTETFALSVFAIFLLLGATYVRAPKWSSLVATSLAGIVLVSLRTVYVPVTLGAALMLPLLAWPRLGERGDGAKRLTVHLAVAVLATVTCHVGYRHWLGAMAGRPPAYLYADGLFAICAWSPVIMPVDAADDPPAVGVFERMVARRGTEPYGVFYREGLRWEPGWLVDDLLKAYPDSYEANLVAKRAASHALFRDPLGVTRLAPMLFIHYLRGLESDPQRVLRQEQGTGRALSPSFVAELSDAFGVDASATPQTMTPSKTYHLVAWPLLLAPLFAPLLCVAVPWPCRRDVRAVALWVCGAFVILAAGTFQFSLSPSFRYLHPFDFAAALVLAVCADTTLRVLRPRPQGQRA